MCTRLTLQHTQKALSGFKPSQPVFPASRKRFMNSVYNALWMGESRTKITCSCLEGSWSRSTSWPRLLTDRRKRKKKHRRMDKGVSSSWSISQIAQDTKFTFEQNPPAGCAARGCGSASSEHLEACCLCTARSESVAQTCCWIPDACRESPAWQSPPCTSIQWGCSAKGSLSTQLCVESGCSSGLAMCWHGNSWCDDLRHISPRQARVVQWPSQCLEKQTSRTLMTIQMGATIFLK